VRSGLTEPPGYIEYDDYILLSSFI
jgi:hypothetical protein